MTYSHGLQRSILGLALTVITCLTSPLAAQEGGAKKAAVDMFEVQCRVIKNFKDAPTETLTQPKIAVLAGHSGKISIGGERTITVAPKTTQTVFEGTSISVTIRKGAKGKHIFDIEGTRSTIESDGLRHTQVKKRSNRVVSPLELGHKFIVPMQPATKMQNAIDLEFTVKRVKK